MYNDFTDRLSVENGTVNYVANTEEFREGLRFIRSLIEEELIDPVSLTITEDEAHVLTGGDVATVGVDTAVSYTHLFYNHVGHGGRSAGAVNEPGVFDPDSFHGSAFFL